MGLIKAIKGLFLPLPCDFAQNKAELVQICALLPASFIVSQLWSRKSIPNIKGNIKNLTKQKFPRYHWFSPFPGKFPALVADFQIIASISFKEIEHLERNG